MKLCKYVVNVVGGNKKMYIFPLLTDHNIYVKHNRLEHVVTAGFISIYDDLLFCTGKSMTLELAVGPDDQQLLRDLFGCVAGPVEDVVPHMEQ